MLNALFRSLFKFCAYLVTSLDFFFLFFSLFLHLRVIKKVFIYQSFRGEKSIVIFAGL